MSEKPKVAVGVKARVNQFHKPIKFTIEFEETITFTAAKAYAFLELQSFEGERPVRERHVQFLYDEWAAGRFLWHNVQLASALLDGVEYRINGQHTCWMRVNIPPNKEPVDTRGCTMRRYRVPTAEDLRQLYSAFDRGAPRTTGHISKVLLLDTDAAEGIPGSYLTRLVAGFRIFFAEDWHTANANPNDLTGLISKSYPALFQAVGHFVRTYWDDAPICRRAAILAAMFATFEKNVKASIEFWTPVWTNVGHESKNDARWRLRQFIDSRKQTTTGLGNDTIGAEDMFRCCILAYNHWRAGESVATIRTTDVRRKPRA